MDFGSKICTAKNPLCNDCIFNNDCKKFFQDTKYTQTIFKGSDREIRGKVIKYLVNNENINISTLNHILKIEEAKLNTILEKLENEGMISIKKKKLIEISP